MDPGTSLAVVGLAGQLFSASLAGYEILSNAAAFGSDYNEFIWQTRLEKEKLSKWAEHWLNGSRLDPSNERHQLAVATLARIAAVFVNIDELDSKYSVQTTAMKPGDQRSRLSISRAFGSMSIRKRSPHVEISEASIDTLATSLPLGQQQAPRLRAEISGMKESADRLQQSLSTWRKLRWAVTDKAKVTQIAERLGKYNKGLYELLPLAEGTLTNIQSAVGSLFKVSPYLPYRQNANFCGREDLLKQIQVAFDAGKARQLTQRTVILHGLGGTGKSQLALEYAYRRLKLSTGFTTVFWIDVTNSHAIEKSAIAVAERLLEHYEIKRNTSRGQVALELGLPLDPSGHSLANTKECGKQAVRAVRKWMESSGNDDFLVVLDNWDDLETDINVLLPPQNGNVLITSRQVQLHHIGYCLEVDIIEVEAGIQLLKASTGKSKLAESEEESAAALARKLGYLPLALDQAGSYISSTQISFAKYDQLYTKNFKQMASKRLRIRMQNDRNDTVFTTWEISFQQLSEQAKELLLLCGVVGNQDIIDEMFERAASNEFVTGYITWMNGGTGWVQDAIGSLLSLSFTKRIESSQYDSVSMHPLVHTWARERLDAAVRIRKETEAVVLLGSFFKSPSNKELEDWNIERRIYPHVMLAYGNVMRHMERTGAWEERLYQTAISIARLLINHGNSVDALPLLTTIHMHSDGILDGERISFLFESMGLAFRELGHLEEALERFKKSLAEKQKTFGAEHLSTLHIVSQVGWIHYKLGNLDEALLLFKRVLVSRERALSSEHPDTLIIINNIASVFITQGKLDDAFEWYRRALVGMEKALGAEHPDTLYTVFNIGLVYNHQGKYDDAMKCYKQAFSGYEKALGTEHPHTLNVVNNIGVVYCGQKKYEDALLWHRQALAGREKVLGMEHTDTLDTVHNIGVVFYIQGKYEDALQWHRRALAGREKTLGMEHTDTLNTVYLIGMVFHDQGNYKDALQWYRRALSGWEHLFSEWHPTIIAVKENISILERCRSIRN